MKIFKHIFSIIAAFTLLTACTEELDDFQLSDITITATWEGDHPSYKVEYTNCAPEDITEIGIFETFIDNQWHNIHEKERIIKLSANNTTCSDTYWKEVYGGDAFEAIAFIKCKNGNFRSEKIRLAVPVEEAKVTEVKVHRDDVSGFDVKIIGSGFLAKANYRLASHKAAAIHVSPTEIEFVDFYFKHYGSIKDTLIMNDKKVPFEFYYEGPKITNVSATKVEVGEWINLQISNIYDRCEFSNAIKLEDRYNNSPTIVPNVTKAGKYTIKLFDGHINDYCDSIEVEVVATKWKKTLNFRADFTHLIGSKLYTQNQSEVINVYNCDTGTREKSYTWRKGYGVDAICISGNTMYIGYLSTEGVPSIDKLDMTTSKVTKFATINEGSVNKIWEKNGTIYVLTTGWPNAIHSISPNGQVKTELESQDSADDIISYDNGNLYAKAFHGADIYSWNDDSFTKVSYGHLQKGNSSDIILNVIDGWIYRSILYGSNSEMSIVYKTRLSSLKSNPETICLGNSEIDGYDGTISTDGVNYYFLSRYDYEYQVSKRPVE